MVSTLATWKNVASPELADHCKVSDFPNLAASRVYVDSTTLADLRGAAVAAYLPVADKNFVSGALLTETQWTAVGSSALAEKSTRRAFPAVPLLVRVFSPSWCRSVAVSASTTCRRPGSAGQSPWRWSSPSGSGSGAPRHGPSARAFAAATPTLPVQLETVQH